MSNKTKGLAYIFQGGELPIRPRLPRPGFVPPYEWLTKDNFDEVYQALQGQPDVSFDTETTSLHIDELLMVGFSFAFNARNYVCLVNHSAEQYCFTDADKLNALVSRILNLPYCYMWNASFDLRVAEKALGICPYTIYPVDVMSSVFLADTNVKMPSLKDSSLLFLGIKSPTFEETFGSGANIQYSDPLSYGQYAAFDSYNTYHLGKLFVPEISKRYRLPFALSRKMVPTLMYFEDTPSYVSSEVLKELQVEVCRKIAEVQSKIYDAVGVFLISSTQQLSSRLISLGYDTGDRTETGAMSVSTDSLHKIENKAPFIKWIIEFKKLVKLNGSYIQPLLLRNEYGLPHRFHYIDNNAPTMRLAAGAHARPKKKSLQQRHYFVDMNIQAVSKPPQEKQRINFDPKTFEVEFTPTGKYLVETGSRSMNLRRAWKCFNDERDKDFVYWAIDYAGQELRIAANLSLEDVWVNTFLSGGDVHKQTAISIWGEENYNKTKRKLAKTANFGTVYGGGTHFLQQKLGMDEQEAIAFQEAFRGALPKLFSWIDSVHAEARRTGYIITPYGVPRRLSYYYALGRRWAGFADRSAANTMIQGSAGMIIRLALTRLFTRIAPKLDEKITGDFYNHVFFRESIHDEIAGVCRRDRFQEFIETVVPLMTDTIPKSWPVPMEVEASVGPDWGSLIAFDHHSIPYLPIEVEEDKSEDKALIQELTPTFDGEEDEYGDVMVDESMVPFFG